MRPGIASGDSPFRGLVLVERDADGILEALGLDREALGERLITVPSAERLAANLADPPGADRVPASGRGRPVGARRGLACQRRCSGPSA